MMTILLITICLVSIAINIALFFLIRRLLYKIETYEKWILDFKFDVETTYESMKKLDASGTFATSMNDKGTFESDDQVGHIFQNLVNLIKKLNDKTE